MKPVHNCCGTIRKKLLVVSTGLCVLGTAAQHIEKLEELKSIGVDQFAGYLQHDNKEETLRVYGETVIPALSDHLTAKA